MSASFFARQHMTRTVGAVLWFFMTAGPTALAADTSPTNGRSISIDQVTDPTATVVFDMFRFEPNLVQLPEGGVLRFENSHGQHTVVNIKGLIPEGTEPISISNTQTADVEFAIPGLYVLSCKIHGRFGMAMIVSVGSAEEWRNPPEDWRRFPPGKTGEKVRELLEQLQR